MEKFIATAEKMFGKEKVAEYQERASKMSEQDMQEVLSKFQAIPAERRTRFIEEIKKEIK